MKLLFTATFGVALAAFILPWVGRFGSAVDFMAGASLVLTGAWFVLLALTLIALKRRGLWALLALPFVIYWPCVLWLVGHACSQNASNCP